MAIKSKSKLLQTVQVYQYNQEFKYNPKTTVCEYRIERLPWLLKPFQHQLGLLIFYFLHFYKSVSWNTMMLFFHKRSQIKNNNNSSSIRETEYLIRFKQTISTLFLNHQAPSRYAKYGAVKCKEICYLHLIVCNS